MSVLKASLKMVVSVSEMARMCQLSRSRFYALVGAGVFPPPVQNDSCTRPYYDANLQHKCLEIRRTGTGFNGQFVIFNQKRQVKRTTRPKANRRGDGNKQHSPVVEALKALGLTATGEEVATAIDDVFPDGTAAVEQGEVVRGVFLYLQRRR